jgi:hypothetical protein
MPCSFVPKWISIVAQTATLSSSAVSGDCRTYKTAPPTNRRSAQPCKLHATRGTHRGSVACLTCVGNLGEVGHKLWTSSVGHVEVVCHQLSSHSTRTPSHKCGCGKCVFAYAPRCKYFLREIGGVLTSIVVVLLVGRKAGCGLKVKAIPHPESITAPPNIRVARSLYVRR